MDNFSNFLAFPLEYIPFVAITLIAAFTVHEFSHAYVAYRFGDSTAEKQGRLTLNPIKHLDPFGTILIFLVGFGWAKPVPVNRFFFKNPRRAGILVSFAGPLSNLVLAFLGFFLQVILAKLPFIAGLPDGYLQSLTLFFNIWVHLNLVLFLFNLMPFPPLDGFRIIQDLVSPDVRAKLTQYESYGAIFFLILIITPLDNFLIWPVLDLGMSLTLNFFTTLLQPLL
ncbi:site-2 protease family protein [Bacillus gobiensis]|uniref:site-2 protease family protein n=1 Tax=Bacillus gobiensis TaxID=1441095 RepID=UPI003D1F78EF